MNKILASRMKRVADRKRAPTIISFREFCAKVGNPVGLMEKYRWARFRSGRTIHTTKGIRHFVNNLDPADFDGENEFLDLLIEWKADKKIDLKKEELFQKAMRGGT